MRIAMFSAQAYDRRFFDEALGKLRDGLPEISYFDAPLRANSVVLAQGCDAACVFVNDSLDATILKGLHALGVRAVLLRCAGYNNLDLQAARELGLFVARVPAYSPEAVAEHAVALVLTLNRKTHRAYARVREGNFSLEGLLGTNLHGKTVGIVGTGRIGLAAARIFHGFGCHVLAYDPVPSLQCVAIGTVAPLATVLAESDIVSLHCPLNDATHHMIDARALASMKPGAMLVNTSRGGLVDTAAVIAALKAKRLGALAIDVYEQEAEWFYQDHSADIIDDDLLQRLLTFPNVLVTGHQGFFTEEAMREIAATTLENFSCFAVGRECLNKVC
jgi:D-lactate dehydrogenase